jgi:L,D-peptidoglycan transpeptidase YkuD (ErfK/YbiS/YcfS/YnhG family)
VPVAKKTIVAVFLVCLMSPCLTASPSAKTLTVFPDGHAIFHGKTYRCALGRSGISQNKKEGDGATPAGLYAIRYGLFRPDKMRKPKTSLPMQPLLPTDGWCDEPKSPSYNQRVKLPFAASHENLWRDDNVYDLILVVGYNDRPVTSGKGSAIFIHVAKAGYKPTAGCVAFSKEDLLEILRKLTPESKIDVQPAFDALSALSEPNAWLSKE